MIACTKTCFVERQAVKQGSGGAWQAGLHSVTPLCMGAARQHTDHSGHSRNSTRLWHTHPPAPAAPAG